MGIWTGCQLSIIGNRHNALEPESHVISPVLRRRRPGSASAPPERTATFRGETRADYRLLGVGRECGRRSCPEERLKSGMESRSESWHDRVMVMMVGGMCARTVRQGRGDRYGTCSQAAAGAAEKRQLLLDPHLESSRSGTADRIDADALDTLVDAPPAQVILPVDARHGMTAAAGSRISPQGRPTPERRRKKSFQKKESAESASWSATQVRYLHL